MSTSYRSKTEEDLAFKEGKENIRLRAKQVMDRVVDELFTEFSVEFNNALSKGMILYVGADEDSVNALFLRAANKALKPKGDK